MAPSPLNTHQTGAEPLCASGLNTHRRQASSVTPLICCAANHRNSRSLRTCATSKRWWKPEKSPLLKDSLLASDEKDAFACHPERLSPVLPRCAHVILSAAKNLRSRRANRPAREILRCAQDDI